VVISYLDFAFFRINAFPVDPSFRFLPLTAWNCSLPFDFFVAPRKSAPIASGISGMGIVGGVNPKTETAS
jgi:hypothetical protein